MQAPLPQLRERPNEADQTKPDDADEESKTRTAWSKARKAGATIVRRDQRPLAISNKAPRHSDDQLSPYDHRTETD
jgi:hypothetical protein